MALSFANISSSPRLGSIKPWGLRLRQVEMTSSDVSVDYATGFDLGTIAKAIGFNTIHAVLLAQAKKSDGTLRSFNPFYDRATGKLRLFKALNAATDPILDTDINDNEVIDLVILGS